MASADQDSGLFSHRLTYLVYTTIYNCMLDHLSDSVTSYLRYPKLLLFLVILQNDLWESYNRYDDKHATNPGSVFEHL